MLRHTFKLEPEARAIEEAIRRVLDAGYGTPDLVSVPHKVSTAELGATIRHHLGRVAGAS
jgi:3-isopropylmalate dehydrogenase